jgi:Domain of unknown function (DUF4145)
MMPYRGPEYNKSGFNCPHCNAYANQNWDKIDASAGSTYYNIGMAAICDYCHKYSIWVDKSMVYPLVGSFPNPHADMPEDVKKDYDEARSIASRSPRSAAALLRLAIEKLTNDLLADDKGKNLNDNIGILVQKGLPVRVQKALDSLRVIGNHAVHPGEIELGDDQKMANSLFEILNIIVDDMITEPAKINEMFDTSLTDGEKTRIKKRDNKQTKRKKS